MTFLRTSIYIDKSIYLILKKYSEKKSLSISEMVNYALSRFIREYYGKKKIVLGKTVKYQDENTNYKLVHYQVDERMYEACLDLRKMFKCSVALIISMSIKEFILNKTKGLNAVVFKMDNYVILYNICIIEEVLSDTISIKIQIKMTG